VASLKSSKLYGQQGVEGGDDVVVELRRYYRGKGKGTEASARPSRASLLIRGSKMGGWTRLATWKLIDSSRLCLGFSFSSRTILLVEVARVEEVGSSEVGSSGR
jgi:hypothetical protein